MEDGKARGHLQDHRNLRSNMPYLNEQQKKKRGVILQSMYDSFLKKHPWMRLKEAEREFTESIDNDPFKLRMINALAASYTPTEEPHESTIA